MGCMCEMELSSDIYRGRTQKSPRMAIGSDLKFLIGQILLRLFCVSPLCYLSEKKRKFCSFFCEQGSPGGWKRDIRNNVPGIPIPDAWVDREGNRYLKRKPLKEIGSNGGTSPMISHNPAGKWLRPPSGVLEPFGMNDAEQSWKPRLHGPRALKEISQSSPQKPCADIGTCLRPILGRPIAWFRTMGLLLES